MTIAGGDAYMWAVEVDGVAHQIAWRPVDGGALRVSFPVSDEAWSPFVRMGASFSPQRTVGDAADAVRRWAGSRAVPTS